MGYERAELEEFERIRKHRGISDLLIRERESDVVCNTPPNVQFASFYHFVKETGLHFAGGFFNNPTVPRFSLGPIQEIS